MKRTFIHAIDTKKSAHALSGSLTHRI